MKWRKKERERQKEKISEELEKVGLQFSCIQLFQSNVLQFWYTNLLSAWVPASEKTFLNSTGVNCFGTSWEVTSRQQILDRLSSSYQNNFFSSNDPKKSIKEQVKGGHSPLSPALLYIFLAVFSVRVGERGLWPPFTCS